MLQVFELITLNFLKSCFFAFHFRNRLEKRKFGVKKSIKIAWLIAKDSLAKTHLITRQTLDFLIHFGGFQQHFH